MAELDSEARSIFLSLVDRPQDQWPEALADACRDRPDLRAKVERLLADHVLLGTISLGEDSDQSRTALDDFERPGAVIAGNYKLLEPLGEGGFGVVYLAEQTAPVRRKVALKILKAGMDTRQVVARFEAERQALAIMDHPNIARVFDGGVTPTGRPFFAMEYVKGVPITEFCDEHKLTPQQRLELFVDVCQAVQHAHQKGIIHRDIKPSNVLVSRHDTTPVVKVIDFGVAKALGQELTDKTLFTNIAQMIGTPLYMSPEQAGMSDLDIDTRSDIYSLGVLLYELLTGATPFSKERFKKAAYDEIRRIIREEDPPKPSTRISESTETLPSVAANRGVEPRRLGGLVRGELDWIVMKALEKDRGRRYETANGFAADVLRYLSGEAVLAVPPSAIYRWRKFARKHRVMLATTAAILVLLLTGIGGTTFGMLRAYRSAAAERLAKFDAQEQKEKAIQSAQREATERKKAEDARAEAQTKEAETRAVLEFVENRVFAAGRPEGQSGGLGHDVTLRKAMDAALPYVGKSFTNQPLIEASLRMTLGASYLVLGESKIAEEQFEQARRLYTKHRGPDHPNTLKSINHLAVSYSALGRLAEALKLREETLETQRRVFPKDHPDTLKSMNNLASSYYALGRHAEALKLFQETLELQRRVLPKDHPHTLSSMMNLANSNDALGRHAEALKLREETLEIRRRVLPKDHPDTLKSMNHLANSYSALGRHAEALKLREETLELQRRVLPKDHPDTLMSMNNLARSCDALGRQAQALKLQQETLEIRRRVLPKDHPDTLSSMMNLAVGYYALGRHAEALKLHQETLETQRRVLPKDHPDTLSSMNNLANSYYTLSRHAEALKLREETLEIRRRVLPKDHPDTLSSMNNLAVSYYALGRHAEALKLREETLEICRRVLPKDHPGTLMSMNNLARSYVQANRHDEALKLVEEFLPKADLPGVNRSLYSAAIAIRVQCYQKAGDLDGCRSTTDLLETRNPSDEVSLYNTARCRAIVASVQAKTPGTDAAALANADAEKAMAWLRKAVAAGRNDAAHIRKDSDLDFLRNRDDFKKLIADLEAKTPPKSKDAPPTQKGK